METDYLLHCIIQKEYYSCIPRGITYPELQQRKFSVFIKENNTLKLSCRYQMHVKKSRKDLSYIKQELQTMQNVKEKEITKY